MASSEFRVFRRESVALVWRNSVGSVWWWPGAGGESNDLNPLVPGCAMQGGLLCSVCSVATCFALGAAVQCSGFSFLEFLAATCKKWIASLFLPFKSCHYNLVFVLLLPSETARDMKYLFRPFYNHCNFAVIKNFSNSN